jgi:Aspartyl protease
VAKFLQTARCDIPFRLVGGAQPLAIVPVTLNGAGPFEFALDTEAAAPVVAPDLARRLGIRVDETKQAAGAGGRTQIDLARVADFAVGETSRRDVSVMISSEITRIAAAVGSTIDGVIGYEFLRHFRLTLDYRRLLLSLEDGPPAEPRRPARTRPRASPATAIPRLGARRTAGAGAPTRARGRNRRVSRSCRPG